MQLSQDTQAAKINKVRRNRAGRNRAGMTSSRATTDPAIPSAVKRNEKRRQWSLALGERAAAFVEAWVAAGRIGVPAAEIAETLKVSDRTLQRCLRDTFRKTLREMTAEERFEQAEHLVRSTDLAFSEVAIRVGYTSQSRMNEAFQHRLGMSPGAARRESLEQGS